MAMAHGNPGDSKFGSARLSPPDSLIGFCMISYNSTSDKLRREGRRREMEGEIARTQEFDESLRNERRESHG